MLNIEIKTVPDDQQRYNTVGDYYTNEKGEKVFVVSDMKDWRYEILTAIHELIESAICKHGGITEEEIDAFDIEYSEQRPKGDTSEPGDNTKAPYHEAHAFADKIEKELAKELGVEWEKYSQTVDTLMRNAEVIE
jgi:hypothetical protein